MKSKLHYKILAVGLTILFMGVSVSSAISINTKHSISKDECEESKEIEENKLKKTSGIFFNYLMAGTGRGLTIFPPIALMPRPHFIMMWRTSEGRSGLISYEKNKAYHINGSQFGISIGFYGMAGLDEFLPPEFLFLGVSVITFIRADSIVEEDL